MKAYSLILALGVLTLPILAATAEENKNESSKPAIVPAGTWVGSLGNTMDGAICIRLDQIVSVTIHSYMLNGTVPITELTIDTTGNNSIRIYGLMTPDELTPDAQKMIGELKKEAAQVGKMPQVAKQYPDTTHAHSIEYSVSDSSQIEGIYKSLMKAMQSGKSTKYSISI